MRIWVDDIRPAPEGYTWCRSVDETKLVIVHSEICLNDNPELAKEWAIELIDLDHDAGDYARFGGGDYIRILDWLEETGRNYPIRIHSQNPVGVQNMRRIIEKNGWEEIR